MTELLLYLISRLVEKLLNGLLFWWGVVRSFCKGKLKQYLVDVAIVNDVDMHVTGQYALNDTMRKEGPEAGNRLQTASCWIGMTTLTKFGTWWLKWLNRRDPDHCAKAVQLHKQNIQKEMQDLFVENR